MHPPLIGGSIKWWCCLTSVWLLTSVCLFVAYIRPKSRTERPKKTKIGTEIAPHHTWLGHHFQGQKVNFRSTCLIGKKGIACAYILLCFALLWQCRHKLGKIAQCLFFHVVIVCVLANSVVNCSLWQFSYLQLIMVRLSGGGGILCRHVHSLLLLLLWSCENEWPDNDGPS